jgi:hypothetical protein
MNLSDRFSARSPYYTPILTIFRKLRFVTGYRHVNLSRASGYDKRGGNAVRVPPDDVLIGTRARGIELLALHEALESLSKVDGRKAALLRRIECRGNRGGHGNLARDGQARLENIQGVGVRCAD